MFNLNPLRPDFILSSGVVYFSELCIMSSALNLSWILIGLINEEGKN